MSQGQHCQQHLTFAVTSMSNRQIFVWSTMQGALVCRASAAQSGRQQRPREMFRHPCSGASSELHQLGMHDHTYI